MRGNGDRCCGKTAGVEMGAAGMEFVFAGTQPGRFRNLAGDNNSGASVRLLGIVEYGIYHLPCLNTNVVASIVECDH